MKRTATRRRPSSQTGFSPAVKLLIRTRAGQGDPENACCEACGRWLGRYGGQCQHIQARQMGGSRHRNTASNGVLLCGTPQSLCHGLCESRDEGMHAAGFWLRSDEDPQPVMLHDSSGGGVTVRLDDLGNYLDLAGTILSAPA